MNETIKSAKELGLLIRKSRIRSGFARAQVAAYSRVGPRFVFDLENGKPTVHIGKVFDVLHALGLTLQIKTRQFGNE